MNGKVIVVTGGFGALGRAVAAAARNGGARIAVIDRIEAGEAEFDLALGGVDLADAGAAGRAMDHVAQRLGSLDGLANLAGGFRWITLDEGGAEAWSELYRINAVTAATASRAALPHLKAQGGAIVSVAAAAAARAAGGMGPYAASKSAVLRLTESLAEELKDAGVRVNAVSPTIIDTPQNRADMPKADFSRWVQPAALADVILFLLSDAARAVTGANLLVAGRV
ncbi:MAG TPA: SDR family oxidoreductase [Caulobacteraceae bacterium]|nr:SDR family oxidoreductase [Caulobacteraceae bacterium]